MPPYSSRNVGRLLSRYSVLFGDLDAAIDYHWSVNGEDVVSRLEQSLGRPKSEIVSNDDRKPSQLHPGQLLLRLFIRQIAANSIHTEILAQIHALSYRGEKVSDELEIAKGLAERMHSEVSQCIDTVGRNGNEPPVQLLQQRQFVLLINAILQKEMSDIAKSTKKDYKERKVVIKEVVRKTFKSKLSSMYSDPRYWKANNSTELFWKHETEEDVADFEEEARQEGQEALRLEGYVE